MRQDIFRMIEADPDLIQFLRIQPIWYRHMMRHPEELANFQTESKYFFRKSIPDRVHKFSNGIQMANMMMSMFQSMNVPR